MWGYFLFLYTHMYIYGGGCVADKKRPGGAARHSSSENFTRNVKRQGEDVECTQEETEQGQKTRAARTH